MKNTIKQKYEQNHRNLETPKFQLGHPVLVFELDENDQDKVFVGTVTGHTGDGVGELKHNPDRYIVEYQRGGSWNHYLVDECEMQHADEKLLGYDLSPEEEKELIYNFYHPEN